MWPIANHFHTRTEDVDPDVLATQSAGPSGGDIANTVMVAAAAAVARAEPNRKVAEVDLTAEIGRT